MHNAECIIHNAYLLATEFQSKHFDLIKQKIIMIYQDIT